MCPPLPALILPPVDVDLNPKILSTYIYFKKQKIEIVDLLMYIVPP